MDIRERIFAPLGGRRYRILITASGPGVLAGVSSADRLAAGLGISLEWHYAEGDAFPAGAGLAGFEAEAFTVALAEEGLLGALGKASGIATAARQAMEITAGRVRLVSGAWKKMPIELKETLRSAILAGGMPVRILDEPFIYLDKNYVRMLGGISQTLQAVHSLDGIKVVQVRGESAPLEREVELAFQGGAGVVMVDTGRLEDARTALSVARQHPPLRVAFAGGVRHADLPALVESGVDIVDMGAAIVDAPLIDLRLDVIDGI